MLYKEYSLTVAGILSALTQQAHNVEMTSYWRRCDVIIRRIDANTTSFWRHVPAGKYNAKRMQRQLHFCEL